MSPPSHLCWRSLWEEFKCIIMNLRLEIWLKRWRKCIERRYRNRVRFLMSFGQITIPLFRIMWHERLERRIWRKLMIIMMKVSKVVIEDVSVSLLFLYVWFIQRWGRCNSDNFLGVFTTDWCRKKMRFTNINN